MGRKRKQEGAKSPGENTQPPGASTSVHPNSRGLAGYQRRWPARESTSKQRGAKKGEEERALTSRRNRVSSPEPMEHPEDDLAIS